MVRPLLLSAVGRRLSSAPLGRREDDVELRRVPVLPTASALDPERPTVIMLDRALVGSAGEDDGRLGDLAKRAALVAIGEPGETEPPSLFPLDLLTAFVS